MNLTTEKNAFPNPAHLILVALCLWACARNAPAQDNLAEELNIDLSVTIAGPALTNAAGVFRPAKTIRLDKSDVISALGKSVGVTFSPKAQLSLALTGTGDELVTVTDATNGVVDVSGYFSFDTASNRVESVSFSRYAGAVRTNVLALETFGLQDRGNSKPLPWHFSVTGVSETECAGVNSQGPGTSFLMTAEVSGSGDYNGEFALFQGSIRADPAHGLILIPYNPSARSSRRGSGSRGGMPSQGGGRGGGR